jgi:hypothetical protein
MSEVPIRSARVPVVLVGAAILGIGIGIWLGSQSPRSASVGPGALATPSPSPTPTSTLLPSTSPPPTPSTSASPVAPPGPSDIILEFSGTEDEISSPFEVVPGWQIQWQTDGASLAIAVTGDQNLGVVVDEPGPASGVTSLAPAGTFRLDIEARGPWSIKVIQGEEPAPT